MPAHFELLPRRVPRTFGCYLMVVREVCTTVANHLLVRLKYQNSDSIQDVLSIARTLPFFCLTGFGNVF